MIKRKRENIEQSNKKQKINNFQLDEKPEDWKEFKKQRKELKLKRKKAKGGFDVIVEAKQLGEKLRRKLLNGGENERKELIEKLHQLLKQKNHYPKFVLAHDTSRIVQWLLKYADKQTIKQITDELVPIALDMIQSKYGIHCVRRLLKYGDNQSKQQIIEKLQGNAVKLASHALSASVFELAYTAANGRQKQYFLQEFFGDLYKNSKDIHIKHIRDVYKDTPSLKAATLSATKANLNRILNKHLLDSTLIQTVLHQFFSECSDADRTELIPLLIPHIVVLSNSKDGVRVAMELLWNLTNKDKKSALKALKEHAIELAKHEHGHCTILALIDATDDTVALNKIILTEIVKNIKDLAGNEHGRKVLFWLVAPGDSSHFHTVFLKELDDGLKRSLCKKDKIIRRQEVLNHTIEFLLDSIEQDTLFWVSHSAIAYLMLAIIKAGNGNEKLGKIYGKIADVVLDENWKVKDEVGGIEDAGMHLVLKRLAQNDKGKDDVATFGAILLDKLEDHTITLWLKLNRSCFIFVSIYENSSMIVQEKMRMKLEKYMKFLGKQTTTGAKILLNKLK